MIEDFAFMLEPPKVELFCGDCLDVVPKLQRKVDLVLTDPPYGTTACKWDTVIPYDKMWEMIRGVRREKAAVVLFGQEPFSSTLRISNIKEFKYDWIWDKKNCGNPLNAKRVPLKSHELVSVFYKNSYYPQGLIRVDRPKTNAAGKHTSGVQTGSYVQMYTNYPKAMLVFSLDKPAIHPTQKPVALLEYLIKTYTRPGETVLDFTMGSGSTGVAAINTGRNFIGVEKDNQYFQIAKQRIDEALLAYK